MPARIALRATLAAAAVLLSLPPALGKAETRTAPFPPLPNIIWELYLPQEYDACTALYPLYSDLPQSDLVTLHRGEKVYLDGKSLPADTAAKLASWFNSARFGCDPPAERLNTDAVRRAAMVWKCEDNVVDFCLRSPSKGLWKKLAIACAPERAEWLKSRLPLFPHWYHPNDRWEGGPVIPEPRITPNARRVQENCFRPSGQDPTPAIEALQTYLSLDWRELRDVYRVYADLSPDQLQALHQEGELQLRFADLPAHHQNALADAVDAARLSGNIGWGRARDFGRSPDARRRHFGITKVVFGCGSYHPDLQDPGEHYPNIEFCPSPHKRVFVRFDTPYPPPENLGVPALKSAGWWVAMPPGLQRALVRWQREVESWMANWMYYEGRQGFTKPGAPPRPLPEWQAQ